MPTDEEIIAGGKVLCKAYHLGAGYDEGYSQRRADEVITPGDNWAKQAKHLADMGYPITGSLRAPNISGAGITGGELLRSVEQLAENVRVTLEAVEKEPEANRKLVAQWRFALNCLLGATHKRGLIPDLKDAGPGAY